VNDRVTGVADGDAAFVDCAGLKLDKVVNMIRGKKGTPVRLQVIPAGAADPSKREVISLVRAEIKAKPSVPVSTTAQVSSLSPDTQSKLDDAVKKIADATRKLLAKNMEKEIGTVVQITALDTTGSAALEIASTKAVDQCLQKSVASFSDQLRSQFKQVPVAQLGMIFSQIDSNAATYAQWLQTQSGNWPDDQPAWKDALKQTLSSKQAAAWDAEEAKRKQAAEEEIGDVLKSVAQFAIEQARPQMKNKVERIEGLLVPSKDRRDKLSATAESLLEQYGADTRARAEKALLAMGDDERKAALKEKQQGFYAWIQPVPDAAWDAGLAKLLTPEETERLQTAGEDRKGRRATAMGKLLLALLDEKIAFTAAQRPQLEPILQRLAKNAPGLVEDQDPNSYFAFSLATFYAAIAGETPDDVKAILDPIQLRHWREVSQMKDIPDGNMYVQVSLKLPAAGDAAKPHPPSEPEDIDRAISDFLDKKSQAQREKILSANILKAEDIARIVHLPDAAALRLQTAARGAAEASMDPWNTSAESLVRSATGGATPESIKQRLDSIQSYQFQQLAFQSQRFGRNPNQNSVWDNTLKAVLTPDQQKAWKQETDARAAYLQQAIAGSVIAAFDERVGLSQDQWAKIEPLVGKFMTDYGEELNNYFAYSNAWFLQSYSIFVPIAAIPEKDLKSILTTEQFDRWTGSNEFSSAEEYWSNLDQNHQQRVKVKR
jgi:SpoVK/Ycf46/Vps4 family AAA+-type ATPase